MRRKLICLIFSLFFCLNIVYADEIPEDLGIGCSKYIIYNLNETKVLFEKNSEVTTSVASVTKIATVITALENSNYTLNDTFTITKSMLSGLDSSMAQVGIKEGQTLTYEDILCGVMIKSGADAVRILEYIVSGSTNEFVNLMNEKTKELGLSNTSFENAIGLYGDQQYSTAKDMAEYLIYALKNDIFKYIFTKREHTLNNGITIVNSLDSYGKSNDKDYSYIYGCKTGHINAAGYCMASIAHIGNVDYLLVTLNNFDGTKTGHYRDAIKIYDYMKKNYGYAKVVSKNDVVAVIETVNSKEKNITIKAEDDRYLFFNKNFDKNNITYKYDGNDVLSYKNVKGEKLGKVDVIYDENVIDSFDIYLNRNIHFDTQIIIHAVIISLIFTGILCVILIFFNKKRAK